ncbi:MAG: S-methyl-5-thioribose-1-phosphate isomerase [Candidatus Omnitrophica bacterium]|nr:S-methyl-5-thioribose-1-phosphate isomerase [Candidatus Omnitrophota bacterium]
MKYETVRWRKNNVELIDQRILPAEMKYVRCRHARDVELAIRTMKVRGAPAIGITGAYGVYLGIRNSRAKDFKSFEKDIKKTIKYLGASRPTARNLFWALERMHEVARINKERSVFSIKRLMLAEAHAVLAEDRKICRAIGKHGSALIEKGSSILTHCNAGGLATADYGTALGVIFAAKAKIRKVYVDETRPRLQGARLTAWELIKAKVPAVLICDNMAASLMAKGQVGAVIVGADRIACNGDTANKIGTYSLAIAAKYHNIPFYVASPISTFDMSISSGDQIPIEKRCESEVKKVNGKYITVKDIKAENPAFDVTPGKLITGIITEKGVVKNPNKRRIKKILNKCS